MIKLITYADDRMDTSAKDCAASAFNVGMVDETMRFGPENLSENFKQAMAPVLACERGAGFYCWKPYVIALAMSSMQDGDYLIWSDAGTTWLQPVSFLIDTMKEDILFFGNGHKHVEWTKMDCLYTMLGGIRTGEGDKQNVVLPIDMNTEQVQASHIIFKVTEDTRNFVTNWLIFTQMPGMIDNEPSVLPNVEGFQEHRWDQSILTCLQMLSGCQLHWFPSTMYMNDRYRFPNDFYPAMFDHHRKRNNEW